MSNNFLLKTALILGTLTAAASAAAVALSNDENKVKVKKAASEFKDKTGEVIRDLERDYKEFDKGVNKISKTKEYKDKVDEISAATKNILKQLQVIRTNSSEILSEVGSEAKRAFTK